MEKPSNTYTIFGINHVGLAPKDPDKCRWFFTEALGLKNLGQELVRDQKTMTLMMRSSNSESPGLEPRLEALQPEAGATETPIGKFLEKKGAGIHHLALTVSSVDQAIASLKAKGVRMIDEAPRNGAHKTRIAFVHPESTGGLLVELVEETGGH